MKTVQFILSLILIINGLNITNAQKNTQEVRFIFEVKTNNITEIKLSKIDYIKKSWNEIKSIKNVTADRKYNFLEQFNEPSLFMIELNTGEKLEFAVEKEGLVELQFGNEIFLKSKTAKITDFKKTIDQLNGKYFGRLIGQYDKAIKEKDQLTINKLEAQKDEILKQLTAAMEQEVTQMGPSAQAYNALSYFDLHKNSKFIKEMTQKFQLVFPNSNMTKSLKASLSKASLVALGAKAPNFKATDSNNTKIHLDIFKGSYILIDFWASWCRACRVENPKFEEIYIKNKEKGFNIISISQDSNISAWKKAIEKDGMSWINIIDSERSINNLYMVSSLPSNILLDREGKIISKNFTADKLNEILKEQFNRETQNK